MNKPASPNSVSQPQALLGWMESLADATRLRLLRLLERHELGVVELCDVLQLPQSTVSRHLKILSDQNWTQSRRQGTSNLYRTILDDLDITARKFWILARDRTANWSTAIQDESRLKRHLKDKLADSQAFFAGAAVQWDKLRGELYGSQFAFSAMLSLLSPDLIVADLGCGTGPLAAELAKYVKQVIAVDSSAAMLKAAQKRLEGVDNVELRRGDLESLPIDDATCDAVIILLVLTYVADPVAAISEARRILKPGGKVVLVDLQPHDRDDFRRQMEQQHAGFDSATIEKMFNASGFRQIRINALSPEANVKGPAMFLASGTKV